jgi:hypothetical protein
LLERYLLWSSLTTPLNFLHRLGLSARVKKTKAVDFVLPHAELDRSYLNFGYKSAQGVYHDLDFVRTKFGYCHGMTMVTRNFAYFAKFDPAAPAPADYDQNPAGWLKAYEGLVDQVMRDKVTVIPGFASLIDFSSSPISNYLHRHVADQWAINTGLVAAYEHIYAKNFKAIASPEEMDGVRSRIEGYLRHGFYPRVVLGSVRYTATDPHVVMLTGLTPPSKPGCLAFTFFNVGFDPGGKNDALEFCVGDRLWIPRDEDLYLSDFAKEIIGPSLN